jgi:hypothetical protein
LNWQPSCKWQVLEIELLIYIRIMSHFFLCIYFGYFIELKKACSLMSYREGSSSKGPILLYLLTMFHGYMVWLFGSRRLELNLVLYLMSHVMKCPPKWATGETNSEFTFFLETWEGTFLYLNCCWFEFIAKRSREPFCKWATCLMVSEVDPEQWAAYYSISLMPHHLINGFPI